MKFCDLTPQWREIEDEVSPVIESILRGGAYIGGEHVEAFEEAFASYHGVKHCIAVGNGTDALTIAMKAAAIQKGWDSWVGVTSPLTFIATANAIVRAGGRLHFNDVGLDCCIGNGGYKVQIPGEPQIVVPVHLYGNVRPTQSRDDCVLIEDCAQAHGATDRNGELAGTLGTAGCFSFFPTKPLGGCGDGGAIITNNEVLADTMRALRTQGGSDKNCVHMLGWNSRLDPIQAVILSAKLNRLNHWNEERRSLAAHYMRCFEATCLLSDGEYGGPVTFLPWHGKPAFHQFVIRVKERERLREALKRKGIPTMVHYPRLVTQHPLYAHVLPSLPTAAMLVNEILSLPFYVGMENRDVEEVVGTVEHLSVLNRTLFDANKYMKRAFQEEVWCYE